MMYDCCWLAWRNFNTDDSIIVHYNYLYYGHMLVGKVWIYRLLFWCFLLCLYGYEFLRRGYSYRRQILLGGSWASKEGNLTFWGTLLPQKPKIDRRIGQCAH